MSNKTLRVLAVDDDMINRKLIKSMLMKTDNVSEVIEAANGMDALDILKKGMQKCPQMMINVPITLGVEIISQDSIQKAVTEAEQQLNNQGRVLLRKSGTEPLIRVMVEGTQIEQVENVAHQLAEVVKAEANRQT